MEMEQQVNKLPLVRIQRNLNITPKRTWLIKILGILASLIICAIVSTILVPGSFFDFFGKLGFGTFGSATRFVAFLEEVAILLIISLALTPAFRMKFWNIGAEGQVLAGSLVCFIIMKFVGDANPNFPEAILWILMLGGSILGGVLCAVIPAIFKAFFNTNETLFTLMMNYIIMGLIVYLISVWYPSGSGSVDPVASGNLPAFNFGGTNYDYIINIIVVAVVTALVFVYMKYTKHGYEIDVVGGSQNTARYVGINVRKVIIRTMVLSGGICGLAGFLLTAGATHSIGSAVVGGRGFTAVLICWLSNLNPLEMILSSSLVAFITKGSNEACSVYFTNGSNYADIMVGIFFFVVIASTFFSKYDMSFPRLKPYLTRFKERFSHANKESETKEDK